jgi:hypothetical protein
MFEQQSGSSAGALHDPVGDFRNFQPGPNGMGDTHQLADAVDRVDKFAKII